MHVVVSCKKEGDSIKNKGARVFTTFLPLKVYRDFFSDAQRAANTAVHGPIRLNYKLSPDLIVVLVTCKYEEDLIKQ